MATEVDLVNDALDSLGQPPITSSDGTIANITSTGKSSRLATRRFANEVAMLLTEHIWNFAKQREELTVHVTAPEWGYAYAYDLAAKHLRVHTVDGEEATSGKWKVEGRQILTDTAATIDILYTDGVVGAVVANMPIYFREAISARLAWKWAIGITGSQSMAQEKKVDWQAMLQTARSADSQEGMPDKLEACEWISARKGGTW